MTARFADCPMCGGSGLITVDWGDDQCPSCSLRAWHEEMDRIRAAAEDSAEQAYRDQYGPDFDKLATYQAEGR